MGAIDEIIAQLSRLKPEQIDEVARIVRRMTEADSSGDASESGVVDEAVQNGWPARLFTEVLGSIPDLTRARPPFPERADL